jgi:hypothetical protein
LVYKEKARNYETRREKMEIPREIK